MISKIETMNDEGRLISDIYLQNSCNFNYYFEISYFQGALKDETRWVKIGNWIMMKKREQKAVLGELF